jgi:hypothetical protein
MLSGTLIEHATEMCTHRRKELYEGRHPETKHGVGRKGKSAQDEHSFVKDTAEKTGKGSSTIRRAATRGKRGRAPPHVRETVSLDTAREP